MLELWNWWKFLKFVRKVHYFVTKRVVNGPASKVCACTVHNHMTWLKLALFHLFIWHQHKWYKLTQYGNKKFSFSSRLQIWWRKYFLGRLLPRKRHFSNFQILWRGMWESRHLLMPPGQWLWSLQEGGRLEGSGCDKAFKGQKDNECVNCKTSFWKTVDNLGEI